MVLYARLGLALVRSLRSLWYAHCVRFGTLTAFALARSLRSLWHAHCVRFCTGFALWHVRFARFCRVPFPPKAPAGRVQKAEGRAKGREAPVPKRSVQKAVTASRRKGKTRARRP